MESEYLRYEQDFESALKELETKLSFKSTAGLFQEFSQAERALNNMERVFHSLPSSSKHTHYCALKAQRQQLEKLRSPQLTLLRTSGELLIDQSSRLEYSKSLGYSAQSLASSTLVTLQSQGDQIRSAAASSQDITKDLSRSNKLMNVIYRRSLTNKLIMVGIIFLLILSILATSYVKFLHR